MNSANHSAPLTILVVEDHDDTRLAMTRWFELGGHTVLAAATHASGLELGRQHAFDLLLCDLQLPDGDGSQLMSALAGEKSFIGIAVSGHGAPADLARTKEAGFFLHMIKPFAAEELEIAFLSARHERDRRAAEKNLTLPVPANAPLAR
jgi:CheY-like chemotaxis protein